VCIGDNAGEFITTGDGHIMINSTGGSSADTEDNVICLNINPTAVASGDMYVQLLPVSSQVSVEQNATTGELTQVSSSSRYKDEIDDLDWNTSRIYDFQARTFYYKHDLDKDFRGSPEYARVNLGYIAEEIDLIMPEIVVYKKINDVEVPDYLKYDTLTVLIIEEMKNYKSFWDAIPTIDNIGKIFFRIFEFST
jgi:hypothetical protein